MLNMLVFVLGTSPDDVQEHKYKKKKKTTLAFAMPEKKNRVFTVTTGVMCLSPGCAQGYTSRGVALISLGK